MIDFLAQMPNTGRLIEAKDTEGKTALHIAAHIAVRFLCSRKSSICITFFVFTCFLVSCAGSCFFKKNTAHSAGFNHLYCHAILLQYGCFNFNNLFYHFNSRKTMTNHPQQAGSGHGKITFTSGKKTDAVLFA